MTKEFIDLIIERHGNVLNCASIDGLDCNIRGTKNYMYSSSKAATIHFTKYCALNYSNKIRDKLHMPWSDRYTTMDKQRFFEIQFCNTNGKSWTNKGDCQSGFVFSFG